MILDKEMNNGSDDDKMKKHIEGLIAASLTGFHPDGSINLDIIPGYAAMLQRNGVVGVFVNGTTGEGANLTLVERKALAKKWVDSAPEGLRVIIHVGYADQETSRALAMHAADIGADAIGEIGPMVNQVGSVRELADYTARTASSASKLPYYYYHMPSINGLFFPMIEFLQQTEDQIPNLAGIKYTHNDIDDYQRCKQFNGGKYDILFGRDEYLIDGLKVGARGAVGSTYNIMASLYLDLIKAFRNRDIETAQHLQKISADCCRFLHETGNFGAGLKTIMRKIGFDMGEMRNPPVNLTQKSIQALESYIEKTNLLNFLNKI